MTDSTEGRTVTHSATTPPSTPHAAAGVPGSGSPDAGTPAAGGASASEPAPQGAPTPPRKRRRVLRWLRRGLLVIVLLGAVGGELAARFALGLGDPPLFQRDPQIEYLAVPGKAYRRFGNTISYNSFSMRSPEFPQRKADPSELRVMVIGDSVVNGGSPSDDSELATTLLPGILSEQLNRPVVVGNISSGSWGPPNQLEYVRRFGLFDADVVAIVLNSEDAYDAPTFRPLGPERPTRKPILALQEVFTLYLPIAYRHHILRERGDPDASEPNPEDLRECLAALERLIETAHASGARVFIVHHFKLTELQSGRPETGHDQIRAVAARAGVRFVTTEPEMVRLLRDQRAGYRDYIHPDAAGQEALAAILAREVLAALRP